MLEWMSECENYNTLESFIYLFGKEFCCTCESEPDDGDDTDEKNVYAGESILAGIKIVRADKKNSWNAW